MMYYIPFHVFVPWPTAYEPERRWESIIAPDSWLALVWICAIAGLWTMNEFANAVFGLRFSNLTNRGIVTAGPYAWFKHPAYAAKVLAWWMTFVPFIPVGSGLEAVRSTILMAMVSVIYYARAKCEERELMVDPVYRAWSAYIDEHGVAARVKRLVGWRKVSASREASAPDTVEPSVEKDA